MLSRRLKKVTYPLRFGNLNGSCMRISTHIDVNEPSEGDYRLFIAKFDDIYMFLLASGRHICAPQRAAKHGISIQSLINLSETFLRISPTRNIAQT